MHGLTFNLLESVHFQTESRQDFKVFSWHNESSESLSIGQTIEKECSFGSKKLANVDGLVNVVDFRYWC